jgi:hypothetical protein
MENEKIHLYRVIPILIISGFTAILSVLLCEINELYLDEKLCVVFFDILFLLILIFQLEYDRKQKHIAHNSVTNFSWIAGGFAVSSLMVIGFSYLPNFFSPVMLIPVLMCGVADEMISMSVSLFLVLEYSLTAGGNYYELVCYCILVLLGVILAKTMEEKQYRICVSVILFCIDLFLPALFYALSFRSISYMEFLYGAGCGAVTALFALLYYNRMKAFTMAERNNRLSDILSDDFSAVKALKTRYPAEYAHAKQVSDLSARCGKELGMEENLCAAAGFYYRLGRWQGQPYTENILNRAEELSFPEELTSILVEYYGEDQLPTTPESALIHMVDALTVKLAAMDNDVKESTWNLEMIIYQTLNEYSRSGIYDQSGMSMNQFLKVREVLTKENWNT